MLKFCSKLQRKELRCLAFQLGFSLVELIVTVGIGGLVLAGIVSALLMQESSSTQLRQSLEASEVENELRLILGDADSCRNTIGMGVPPDDPANPPQLMQVRNSDGSVAIQAPRIYSNLIRLDNFELKRVLKPTGNPMPGAAAVGGRWQYALIANFTPLSGTTAIRPRSVELYVEVNGSTGLIVGCVGKVMQPSYNCQTLSATTNSTSIRVSCDNVVGGGYRVVSCGMLDSDPAKNGWRRMVPKDNSSPNGCWCYDQDGSGSLQCRALCCRY